MEDINQPLTYLSDISPFIHQSHLIAKSTGSIEGHKLVGDQISSAIVGHEAMKFVKFSGVLPGLYQLISGQRIALL